ncbi:MAG: tRNA (adenosine(37)-N6)-threonylcarbamoyltransferase complex dimerization subunit type 1 TsaB [Stellaceae bacterium]
MYILGLDSAGNGASVALLRDGAVVSARVMSRPRGQAEILMPMIDEALREARIEARSLDAIGVATGPGSFTGLRIAVAAARGLALATGAPAIGVTRFAAVAAQFSGERRDGRALLVALDTRRDDFFLQLFADRDGEPRLAGGDDAASTLPKIPLSLAGDAAYRLASFLSGRDIRVADEPERPLAEPVARLAAAAFRPGMAVAPPRPLYLRPPDTTMPRRGTAQ